MLVHFEEGEPELRSYKGVYTHSHDRLFELFDCWVIVIIRYHLNVLMRPLPSTLCLVQYKWHIQKRLWDHCQHFIEYLLVIPLYLYWIVSILHWKRFCSSTFHDCSFGFCAHMPCFLCRRASLPSVSMQRMQETIVKLERVGIHLFWRSNQGCHCLWFVASNHDWQP